MSLRPPGFEKADSDHEQGNHLLFSLSIIYLGGLQSISLAGVLIELLHV